MLFEARVEYIICSADRDLHPDMRNVEAQQTAIAAIDDPTAGPERYSTVCQYIDNGIGVILNAQPPGRRCD
ncbi:hypothetical protein ACM42_14315 [Bradyrhizobium sp. CCBAU 25338]|nr:hypothetical protein [Bradyrhizobium sp. CCBAU 25338]